MAKEFKTVDIPVASHGFHKHPFNYPYVGTGRFMEVFPTFYEPLSKGGKSAPKGGFYSLLLPLSESAFFTGRYHFKGVFIPYTYVFKPWYHFLKGIKYQRSDGTESIYGQAPNCKHGTLTAAFLKSSNGFVTPVNNPTQSPQNWDILYTENQSVNPVYHYYTITNDGARVLKVLNGLGIAPTWIKDDDEPVLLIDVLCYIKGFLDVYFPGQYVGTKTYTDISAAILPEGYNYDTEALVSNILIALKKCSTLFYDKSIFDYCWDDPSGPTDGGQFQKYHITDQTYASRPEWVPSSLDSASQITNDRTIEGTFNVPQTGAYIGNGVRTAGDPSFTGRITQFALQALTSLSNWMKRNQLAGSRLIENYLVEHGFKLDNYDAQQSYVIGDEFVEINVSSVENNSSTNLGELAGKGVASTSPDKPISFECNAAHDGVFIIYTSIEPDCEMPVYNDAYNSRVYTNDFYHAEFDKLGVEGVRQICAINTLTGAINAHCSGKLFGFLNRYFGDVQEKPRLTGDFRIWTRGSKGLASYHSLRTFGFGTVLGMDGLYHSFDFLDGSKDMEQYQRIFYSDINDNLLLYVRWFGENEKEKLPMGDSYYWSDDEFNKKVKLINQGMKH